MTNVLIIEDHEMIQDSLESALAATGEFAVVGRIASADYALSYCDKLQPDLVLLDICTEGGASGLNAAAEIRQQYPDLKIIVMTGFDEISYLPRAKAAGADGFVYKSRSMEFFLSAVKKVMAGEKCFPEPKIPALPQGTKPLTEREMEILRLVCKHMTTKEIAKEIFLSEDTVKYHKKNMLAKTGFASMLDLAFYMVNNGWINPLY